MTIVFQNETSGLWSFSCSLCPGTFDGAFPNKTAAERAAYRHWLRSHA